MDTEVWTLAVILWEKLDSILGQGEIDSSTGVPKLSAINTSLEQLYI
jgi:hypothetical protein